MSSNLNQISKIAIKNLFILTNVFSFLAIEEESVDNSSNSEPLSVAKTEKKLTTPAAPNKELSGWIITALVAGAFLVGGLLVWLFVRQKKNYYSSLSKEFLLNGKG